MEPYAIEAITHHEEWFEEEVGDPIRQETISLHLESDPFIVPPVLTKSALVDQPILRLIWQQGYHALRSAHHVVFIGYSLPITDVAVSILFDEALEDIQLRNLSVVNLAETHYQRRVLTDAYKSRLDTKIKGLTETQFDFRGALEWSRDLVGKVSSTDS